MRRLWIVFVPMAWACSFDYNVLKGKPASGVDGAMADVAANTDAAPQSAEAAQPDLARNDSADVPVGLDTSRDLPLAIDAGGTGGLGTGGVVGTGGAGTGGASAVGGTGGVGGNGGAGGGGTASGGATTGGASGTGAGGAGTGGLGTGGLGTGGVGTGGTGAGGVLASDGGGQAGSGGATGGTFGADGGGTSCASITCGANATCDNASGSPACHCVFPYQGDGTTCAPYASCAALLAANPQASSGKYPIKPSASPTLTAYCEMSADGGGWMLVTQDMIASKKLNNVNLTYGQDDNGGVIVSVAGTVSDCGVDVSSLITIGDTVPWTKIRSRQIMGGAASCWSIFGDNTDGPDDNLIPFQLGVDSIHNEVAMGGWNGDPFDGITTRCDNALANFWHAYNGYGDRSAIVVLRRDNPSAPAGLATATSCTLYVGWRYEQILIR